VNVYYQGQQVTVQDTITLNGVLTDPTTVACKVEKPDGTITAYTLALGQVVKVSTGVYTYTITTDADGHWRYRFEATGPGEGAGEGVFFVKSDFV